MEQQRYKIMIVAGEASGDAHAAKLVKAIKDVRPGSEIEFFGSAGGKMREAGVDAIVNADGLSIMGLPEIARALPMFMQAYRKLTSAAMARRPDVVVLVDFPEFNLKLARTLKKRGLKVVYYISPQLWAWRQYRKRTIKKYVDVLITILPFEKNWYAARGISNVEYVGNPLAREVKASSSRDEFRHRYGIDSSSPLIALLPGSRHKEIVRILPVMLQAASIIEQRDPKTQFVIALAPTRNEGEVQEAFAQINAAPEFAEKLIVVKDETIDALNASNAAAVASGTATMEAGLVGTPMTIVYKASSFNFKLVRPLINTEHFGLINLIAGERVAAELIQDDLTPESLSNELVALLDPEQNSAIRNRLSAVAEKLGRGGASTRAAEIILGVMENDVPD